jgi:cytidylate kinase
VPPEAALTSRLDVTVESLLERIVCRIHLRQREVLTLVGLNRDASAARQGERDHGDGTRQGTGHGAERARALACDQAQLSRGYRVGSSVSLSSPRMSAELIVIDGPAGAGKSTVARAVAERLGASLLDTGAIYRSLALIARKRSVDWDDEGALAPLAAGLRIDFRPARAPGAPQMVIILAPLQAGESPFEVTTDIRTSDISEGASRVSRHPAVRSALLDIQRAIAATSLASGRSCVAEGRDMGTVVFPDAPNKFFLTASRAARADRRHRELLEKGEASTPAQVEAQMATRDERDSSREAAPLVQADDAVLIDSSDIDVEGVVAQILAAVAARLDQRDGSP